MGMIKIEMKGSFLEGGDFTVSAEEGGHALAIQRAMSWLNEKMGSAIRLDHSLQEAGTVPPVSPFGEIRKGQEAQTRE